MSPDNHHTVPKYLLRRLFELENDEWTWEQARDFADSIADNMPGMLVHKKDHVGIDEEGLASFHRMLAADWDLPTPIAGSNGRVRYDKHSILTGLKSSYQQWDREDAWVWAKQWLQQNGIDTTGY